MRDRVNRAASGVAAARVGTWERPCWREDVKA